MWHVCCLFIANDPELHHQLLTDCTSVPTGDCQGMSPSSSSPSLFPKNHTFPRTGTAVRGTGTPGGTDVQTLHRRRAVIRRMSRAVSRDGAPFADMQLSIHQGVHINGAGGKTSVAYPPSHSYLPYHSPL